MKRGQLIGRVGETGSFSGPGLYFEIRHKGKPLDPAAWCNRNAKHGPWGRVVKCIDQANCVIKDLRCILNQTIRR